MIILDTNVLSDLMRTERDPQVGAWFRRHRPADLFITAITEAEIWFGIELLPDGRRKSSLEEVARTMLTCDFAGRSLAYDSRAAERYGHLAAALRRAGTTVGLADIQIAAIAQAQGFALASRNTRHFEHCGIELIDPFANRPGG